MEANDQDDPDEVFVIEGPGIEVEGEATTIGNDEVQVKVKKTVKVDGQDPSKE